MGERRQLRDPEVAVVVADRAEDRGAEPGGDGADTEADEQRGERPQEQPPPLLLETHARGGERQQVGADRHGADDEDAARLDHADPRDHTGDGHQREIATEES